MGNEDFRVLTFVVSPGLRISDAAKYPRKRDPCPEERRGLDKTKLSIVICLGPQSRLPRNPMIENTDMEERTQEEVALDQTEAAYQLSLLCPPGRSPKKP